MLYRVSKHIRVYKCYKYVEPTNVESTHTRNKTQVNQTCMHGKDTEQTLNVQQTEFDRNSPEVSQVREIAAKTANVATTTSVHYLI